MDTRRPIIGIATSMNDSQARIMLNLTYFRAIWGAGAIPVALPFAGCAEDAKTFFESFQFSGFLFAGGCDVNPVEYGEEITAENVEFTTERDKFELELARLLLPTQVPVLGICRGVQTLNVAFGGTLCQDIPNHRQELSGKERPEAVDILPGTVLHEWLKTDREHVNTFHHQCVKDVAPGFVASAISVEDGIIEAIEPEEKTERFLLGVQWHPEIYYGIHPSSNIIFNRFITAARNYMAKKY